MSYPVLETGYKSPTSVFETSTTQQHVIGARGVLGDRVFHYTRFLSGVAIGPNKLAQMSVPIANHVGQAGEQTGTKTTASTTVTLEIGNTIAAEDYYKDGYLSFEDATNGKGCIHHVKSNTYTAAAATITLTLYDTPITLTTGNEVWGLHANPWGAVVIGATTAPAAGVPLINFAACSTAGSATAGYIQTGAAEWTQPQYGWFQTWGACSVLQDGSAVAINTGVIAITGGAVGVEITTSVVQRVGIGMRSLTSDGEYGMIFLTIAP